jgi:subtilisin
MTSTEITETISSIGYAKVLVTLAPQALAGAAAAGATAPVVPGTLSAKAQKSVVRSAEARLKSNFMDPTAGASAGQRKPKRIFRVYANLGLALGYVDQRGMVGLEANAAVARVEKAPELSLIRPVDSRQVKSAKKEVSWGIAQLEIDRLWAAGLDGTGVIVGHLDTGIDGAHPALQGAIHAFAEFDMNGDQVVGASPYDSDEHGTHTAGTIVGRTTTRGTFGVAPGAKVASGLVIEGGQVVERILSGLDWIIGQNCRILSMSLGLRGYTPAFEQLVNALRAARVLPVIAVGNEGWRTSRSPGNYINVLSVGAADANNEVPEFSSSQTFTRQREPLVPDLVAPGVSILSCVPNNGYAEMDGTSMATPHVAGLAAILLQAKPDATIDELENAILNSCERPKTMRVDRANRGVPNGPRAYELLMGTPVPQPAGAAAGRRVKVAAPKRRTAGGKRPPMPVKKAATKRAKPRARVKATGTRSA